MPLSPEAQEVYSLILMNENSSFNPGLPPDRLREVEVEIGKYDDDTNYYVSFDHETGEVQVFDPYDV